MLILGGVNIEPILRSLHLDLVPINASQLASSVEASEVGDVENKYTIQLLLLPECSYLLWCDRCRGSVMTCCVSCFICLLNQRNVILVWAKLPLSLSLSLPLSLPRSHVCIPISCDGIYMLLCIILIKLTRSTNLLLPSPSPKC